MDKIEIRNLEIFANHGVFPEENVLGQKFVVSATLYTDTGILPILLLVPIWETKRNTWITGSRDSKIHQTAKWKLCPNIWSQNLTVV